VPGCVALWVQRPKGATLGPDPRLSAGGRGCSDTASLAGAPDGAGPRSPGGCPGASKGGVHEASTAAARRRWGERLEAEARQDGPAAGPTTFPGQSAGCLGKERRASRQLDAGQRATEPPTASRVPPCCEAEAAGQKQAALPASFIIRAVVGIARRSTCDPPRWSVAGVSDAWFVSPHSPQWFLFPSV
jgi:hypothetical protein